ncbi:MAG: hypothetical protein MZV64_23840 [Ignavibacteriales bacterium]|nr:hypothetical protein [Ignavibacteriales bacterium]
MPLEKGGFYVLRARASAEGGRTTTSAVSFYVIGAGYTAWARYDHNRIDLVPEKKTLAPWDTARVLVKSPLGEGDRARDHGARGRARLPGVRARLHAADRQRADHGARRAERLRLGAADQGPQRALQRRGTRATLASPPASRLRRAEGRGRLQAPEPDGLERPRGVPPGASARVDVRRRSPPAARLGRGDAVGRRPRRPLVDWLPHARREGQRVGRQGPAGAEVLSIPFVVVCLTLAIRN